jgi:hypothetical protein
MQYQRSSELVLDRPNHQRIDGESDKSLRTVLYDGKTLTVFDPDMNIQVQAPAPVTIDATLNKPNEEGIRGTSAKQI